MTVTTTGVRETKDGDGVTISWSFSTFVALDPSHVKVKLRDETDGTITTLVYGLDYSVSLTGTARPAAGSITLLGAYAATPPDSDTEIEIYRDTPATQETPLDPRSAFSSGNPEAIFDRYVLLAQEAFDRARRALVLDPGDEPSTLDFLPVARALKYLGFDANKQPVALDAPADTTAVSVYMAALLGSASEAALKAAMNAEAGVDFAAATLALTAGAGLTGGGTLEANRSFAVGAGTGIVVNADDVAVDKATQANMEAAAANKVVTADVQHFHRSAAKVSGYVTYSGGTPTLQDSYNVTSITDVGTGDLDVTIANDFSSANYAPLVSFSEPAQVTYKAQYADVMAGVFTILVFSNAAAVDPVSVAFACLGDLP